eukprot:10337549-Alexandrium_andersonii.AAC.1
MDHKGVFPASVADDGRARCSRCWPPRHHVSSCATRAVEAYGCPPQAFGVASEAPSPERSPAGRPEWTGL